MFVLSRQLVVNRPSIHGWAKVMTSRTSLLAAARRCGQRPMPLGERVNRDKPVLKAHGYFDHRQLVLVTILNPEGCVIECFSHRARFLCRDTLPMFAAACRSDSPHVQIGM